MWRAKKKLSTSNGIIAWNLVIILVLVVLTDTTSGIRKYTRKDVDSLREEVRDMFQHAYEGYLQYASDYDELRPLTCDGVDTWGSYSLTLIDSLDTLAVMGNYSEFRRVVNTLIEKSNFDSDINVSVFETNIRIVGGLISAHLVQHKAEMQLEPGWPCNGPLLRMAEDVARRLLPAFDTTTGMPYGTVNLMHGVPANETTVTCTAGVGTFIVEFGALSRLTGDPIYEEVALNAIQSLHRHKSAIGLYGNHIDVQTGRWTAVDAGIGAGVDSYYEYLVKGSIMLNRPELLAIFHESKAAIDKYLLKNDWHVWVSMTKGQVTLPVFQSLDAYWPGVLSMIGDISGAMKSIYNYHSVWKQYGFLPEFYNIPNAEAGTNRESYPLRPELIESAMYLYRATGDPYLLGIGEDMLRSIQSSAKTECGYATIKNVRDHRKDNRMESFFLSETTKYLYLLFDPDNFLNNNGGTGTIIDTPNGQCVIYAGGYIFNTEAHAIDPSALRCCHDVPREVLLSGYDRNKFMGDVVQFSTSVQEEVDATPEKDHLDDDVMHISNMTTFNIDKLLNTEQTKRDLLKLLQELKARNERDIKAYDDEVDVKMDSDSDDLIERVDAAVAGDEPVLPIVVVDDLGEEIKDFSPVERGVMNATDYAKTKGSDEVTHSSAQEIFGIGEATVSPIGDTDSSNAKDDSGKFMGNKIVPPANTSTIPIFLPYEKRTPFDAQQFLERIRTLYNETSVDRNYELLMCKTQSYVQRLAVFGEVLADGTN